MTLATPVLTQHTAHLFTGVPPPLAAVLHDEVRSLPFALLMFAVPNRILLLLLLSANEISPRNVKKSRFPFLHMSLDLVLVTPRGPTEQGGAGAPGPLPEQPRRSVLVLSPFIREGNRGPKRCRDLSKTTELASARAEAMRPRLAGPRAHVLGQ